MKTYLMPYSSQDTTASIASYTVNTYEELFPLVIKDFFNYPASNEEGNTVQMYDIILDEYKESDDFYYVCNNYGIYFGDPIELEDVLKYSTKAADF